MAPRSAKCITCETDFVSGERGKLPTLCPDCGYKRGLAAARRWRGRNPQRVRVVTDVDRDRSRKWKAANAERVREYRRQLYFDRQKAENTAKVMEYRRLNPGKHAEIENRRRARFLESFVEAVDPAEVRTRVSGMCGICNGFVAITDQSLDHIIPLSKGGTHEYANIQLAHRICNSRKGARIAA